MRSILGAVLVALPAASPRAEPPAATLQVHLTDERGEPVPDARIALSCPGDPPVMLEQSAGSEGLLLFEDLPAGRCLLSAQAPGYRPQAPQPVELEPGSQRSIDLALEWAEYRAPPARVRYAFTDGVPLASITPWRRRSGARPVPNVTTASMVSTSLRTAAG